jgi:DNA repair exonuclease SbcCD ATPase subunit
MTTRRPPDVELIKRVIEELKKRGMDPKELVRQLELNLRLEDKTIQLDHGIEARERTIALREQHLKQLADDDARMQKAHEEQIAKHNAERTGLENELARLKDEIRNANETKTGLGNEITIGRWLLALVRRNPEALRLLELAASLVKDEPSPPPNWTETVAYSFLTLARKELTDLGFLVPKKALDQAKLELFTANQRLKNCQSTLNDRLDSILEFTKHPEKLTTEQKRVLLETFTQLRAETQQGFAQLMKQVESSEKCPIHNTPMVFDLPQRQWVCRFLGCSSRR